MIEVSGDQIIQGIIFGMFGFYIGLILDMVSSLDIFIFTPVLIFVGFILGLIIVVV